MSKSLGNVIAPQDVDAAIRRRHLAPAWVAGSDYSRDIRIGPEILKRFGDTYRRLRNTLRYLHWARWTAARRPAMRCPPRCPSWSAGCCIA